MKRAVRHNFTHIEQSLIKANWEDNEYCELNFWNKQFLACTDLNIRNVLKLWGWRWICGTYYFQHSTWKLGAWAEILRFDILRLSRKHVFCLKFTNFKFFVFMSFVLQLIWKIKCIIPVQKLSNFNNSDFLM